MDLVDAGAGVCAADWEGDSASSARCLNFAFSWSCIDAAGLNGVDLADAGAGVCAADCVGDAVGGGSGGGGGGGGGEPPWVAGGAGVGGEDFENCFAHAGFPVLFASPFAASPKSNPSS